MEPAVMKRIRALAAATFLAAVALLTGATAMLETSSRAGGAASTGYRLQVYSTTPPRLPASGDWGLEYQFTVPPLPRSATWDPKRETVYQWGDVDFDAYGSGGAFKISHYQFNQIVPELFIGSVLARSDAKYKPSWEQRSTWGIEAQYY